MAIFTMMKIRQTQKPYADYPQKLFRFDQHPKMLNYIGHPVWNDRPCLAVVGSRNPSASSAQWLEKELARFLEHTDCCIVSGGAVGIDQVAHKVALTMGRPTVVFLPSGIHQPYPTLLRDWYDAVIQAGGAVVSHLNNDDVIERENFLIRNRWIVGVSDAVLILEARRRSGTMMTARHAIDLNVDVGVVPTSPGDAGMGGLDLIRDGAPLIRDHIDLLDLGQFPKLLGAKNEKDQVGHPTGYANW